MTTNAIVARVNLGGLTHDECNMLANAVAFYANLASDADAMALAADRAAFMYRVNRALRDAGFDDDMALGDDGAAADRAEEAAANRDNRYAE